MTPPHRVTSAWSTSTAPASSIRRKYTASYPYSPAAIGEEVELFVDANGAYERKQALALAHAFVQEAGVRRFEEPGSSDDLEGLALLRARVPAPMQVAAGEYGYELFYFKRMLEAGAVDVLQADVTRCGGITAMLQVDALGAGVGPGAGASGARGDWPGRGAVRRRQRRLLAQAGAWAR